MNLGRIKDIFRRIFIGPEQTKTNNYTKIIQDKIKTNIEQELDGKNINEKYDLLLDKYLNLYLELQKVSWNLNSLSTEVHDVSEQIENIRDKIVEEELNLAEILQDYKYKT